MADQTELITTTTTGEPVPELPGPVEIPEYYPGFGQEFEALGTDLQKAYERMHTAEQVLAKPTLPGIPQLPGLLGSFHQAFKSVQMFPVGMIESIIAQRMTPEQKAFWMADAIAEFDEAAVQFQTLEWKAEVMQVLPIYMSDPFYEITSPEDILKHIPSGVDLTTMDRAWLNDIFSRMEPLMNILPEDYTGDILEAQSNILNNILTEPKLEMRGVHRLTIDEIAKAFVFGVTELPAGMSEADVRDLLGQMDLQDEEILTQREWLEERSRQWALESARMGLIRAGEILATTPELTPKQWAWLVVTQPMMATVELMQMYWDKVSRPLSAAITMNLPAPIAGAVHGLPLGIVAGGTAGAAIGVFGGPIGMAAGAIIGGLVGIGVGAGLFAAFEEDTDKELTEIYEFYRAQGETAWSSYAKAFNEWDAPWWKKMILDSAYDPLMWIGWGGATAIGRKLATAALPRGLKWAGTRVGNLMVAFEQGYVAGADAVFKAGLHVFAAPIKSAFWLTGAGYTIPKTFTQMSRNFARGGMKKFKAVLERMYPSARGWRGLTKANVDDAFDACVRAGVDNPMAGNDLQVRAFGDLVEFTYRDEEALTRLLKGIVDDVDLDIARVSRLNADILDVFSVGGPKKIAGKMFADLGIQPTDDMANALAGRLVKLRDSLIKQSKDAMQGDNAKDMLLSVFNRLEETRYKNLHSPLTKYMQQAGRSASWHSRVADRILYSAQLVQLERRVVMPMARHQLLFFNFGPWNYAENMMRSFLGGGEIMHPSKYSGVSETVRLTRGLVNQRYELIMFERGQYRVAQAIIDPTKGTAMVFRGGRVPFITRDVIIPDWVPRFGGKRLGRQLTVGGKTFQLGSFQDMYDMWAYLGANQMSFDVQTHFLKALDDVAPGWMKGLHGVIDDSRHLLDDIASITKADARDIERVLTNELIGGGPESARAFGEMDILDYQRRHILNKLHHTTDQMTDIHMMTKNRLDDMVLDGSMFSKGGQSIDDNFAHLVAGEREMSVVGLSHQIDTIKMEVKDIVANPPKNVDQFLGDMQHITSHIESVGETIHDYHRIMHLRKVTLDPAERDAFETGSAKMLADYMDVAETEIRRMLDELGQSARRGPFKLSSVQLSRLDDIATVGRLEMDNILATRTKLAGIRAEIPDFRKSMKGLWQSDYDRAVSKSKAFWDSQDARVSNIWNESERVAREIKLKRLEVSRGFLMSVDKPVFVPDSIPEVTGELTANHLAYLYGATGDDLYRGLTRVQRHTTIRPREDFILHTREQASAYGAKVGKTADELGFTHDAIGEVYDQMWRSLGIDPMILTPDHPTMLQIEELRQEMHKLYAAGKIPDMDIVKWRKYVNTVSDGARDLPQFRGIEEFPEWELKPQITKFSHKLQDIQTIASGKGIVKFYHGAPQEFAERLVAKGPRVPYKVEDVAREVAETYGLTYKEFWRFAHRRHEVVQGLSTATAPVASRWAQHFPTGEILSDLNATARLVARAKVVKKAGETLTDAYNRVAAEAGALAKAKGVPATSGTMADMLGLPDKYALASGKGALVEIQVDASKIPQHLRKSAQLELDSLGRGEIGLDEFLQQWNHQYKDFKLSPDDIISSKIVVRDIPGTPIVKPTAPPGAPAGERVGLGGTPEWWDIKEQAMTKANEMHALAYPTYDDANIIDETMRAIFPFWNYELFRWKWMPRTFMRTPGTLTGLARYMDYTDQGYIPIPGTDLQINILRGSVWMGGLRSFYLRDFPEYHDAVPGIEFLDYIGRAGFFPGVHVMLPIIGVSSMVSGERMQWSELAPAWVDSSLAGLRALSPEHIGNVLEVIYPDRFRDYQAMLTLASWGYDGDAIWSKRKQNQALTEDEEKLWLRAVNNVDGIKGVLMNQTGLFRIRPMEFTIIRQEMQLAIEEATGVPVKTQDWISKMYPVTGKRLTDYYHLDIQQQALLYQWESFRRYQGIITPLYPSSWQALDIKRNEYYGELERIYNDVRYNGVYEDGELVQQSIMELNRQLVEGIIGPDQWRSQRSKVQQRLAEGARILGDSPAYKDVPKTFEEMAALLEKRGLVIPTQTPDQELLYYYYELQPELKYSWESQRMELDFDTYYAYIDILLESLSATHRERLLQRIHNDWTPMEILYWEFSREFACPYRNVRQVVLNEYTPEQVQIIRRFEVARGAERDELLEVMGPDGKLISGFNSRLREARMRLRILDPTLDAWLYFFGTTDKFMSHESEALYNTLRERYLTPAMIGKAP